MNTYVWLEFISSFTYGMHPRYWYFLFALTVSSKSLHGQAKIRRIEVPTLPRTMPLPKTISFFKMFWVKVFFSKKVLWWAQALINLFMSFCTLFLYVIFVQKFVMIIGKQTHYWSKTGFFSVCQLEKWIIITSQNNIQDDIIL